MSGNSFVLDTNIILYYLLVNDTLTPRLEENVLISFSTKNKLYITSSLPNPSS